MATSNGSDAEGAATGPDADDRVALRNHAKTGTLTP